MENTTLIAVPPLSLMEVCCSEGGSLRICWKAWRIYLTRFRSGQMAYLVKVGGQHGDCRCHGGNHGPYVIADYA